MCVVNTTVSRFIFQDRGGLLNVHDEALTGTNEELTIYINHVVSAFSGSVGQKAKKM